jgi:hypothetical protein
MIPTAVRIKQIAPMRMGSRWRVGIVMLSPLFSDEQQGPYQGVLAAAPVEIRSLAEK